MKKLILLLSVVAVSFALQAGENTCPNDKATCDKSKAATCDKAKAATCDKAKSGCPAQAEAKGCCPAGGAAKDTAKDATKSPKDSKKS
jgi:hypothetical protein